MSTTPRHYSVMATWLPILTAGLWICLSAEFADSTHGAVVVMDGFGDADRDNKNGTLQADDVDVDLDGIIGSTYEPALSGGNPTLFPAGTTVTEINAVEEASDTGVVWALTRGYTGSGDPKPSIHIVDDSPGQFPETGGIGPKQIEAIDDGLALALESKGRNSSAAAFFPETIELGPEVGDQVKVSFDFRIWLSAPNFNSQSNNHVPEWSELRFGLFEDTDNQLGQSALVGQPNPVSGIPAMAVWGQDDGHWRGDASNIGAIGDNGWYARVPIEDPTGSFRPPAGGATARIVEEVNTDDIFLSGDTDTVALPDQTTPDFVNIDIHKVYTLSLTLERFSDPNSGGVGDTILATLTARERDSGMEWTLSDYEPLIHPATNEPDGISSEAWDYFGITTSGSLDEIDWIMDNFMVEVLGSNVTVEDADFDADGDVDGSDFLVWQRGLGSTGQTNNSTGDANGDGTVTAADLAVWKNQFGGAPASTNVGAVPEPATAVLLLLASLATGVRARAA